MPATPPVVKCQNPERRTIYTPIGWADILPTGLAVRWRACVQRPAAACATSAAEKPMSLYVAEGLALVRAVRKYRRILQVGSQQRSMAMNRVACDFVRTGGLGRIRLVLGANYSEPVRIGAMPEEKSPYPKA